MKKYFIILILLFIFSSSLLSQINSSPVINLSPGFYDFGDVEVSSTEEYTFILENTGDSTATGFISLTNSQHFVITNGEGYFSLNPNEEKNIIVSFNPQDSGDFFTILEADGDGSCNNAESDLYGTGINPIEITLTEPSNDISVPQGEDITIEWYGNGPDNSTVTLFYDEDNTWLNGNEHQIVVGEPSSGSYNWDTESIDPGIYYIAGYITDGNENNYDYAPGIVTIYGNNPPEIIYYSPDSPIYVSTNDTIEFTISVFDLDGDLDKAVELMKKLKNGKQNIKINKVA